MAVLQVTPWILFPFLFLFLTWKQQPFLFNWGIKTFPKIMKIFLEAQNRKRKPTIFLLGIFGSLCWFGKFKVICINFGWSHFIISNCIENAFARKFINYIWNFLDKYENSNWKFVHHSHHHLWFVNCCFIIISCETKRIRDAMMQNEMQKVKNLLIFSGTKSRAVTLKYTLLQSY